MALRRGICFGNGDGRWCPRESDGFAVCWMSAAGVHWLKVHEIIVRKQCLCSTLMLFLSLLPFIFFFSCSLARLLWTAIEKGGVEPHEDMQALDALCSAVPPEMWPVIANKETAKEAWEAIATMRIGDDRVKKASAQNLRRQFDSATFKEGESVEDYALRLNKVERRR
ncbi:unnamed protein product [Spirodela intermedia]|uniref:Uncharacterized protein n=1 Tax=Spirodela intermedia TaxID=51605 RepID=A0ABN7E816_SPIIN|nr:unnamed protein product [Spirodela intermedia]